jgi:hypothetical protein
VYSDRLIEFLLKARRPAIYREQSLVGLRQDPDERRQIEEGVARFTRQLEATSLRDVFGLAKDLRILEESDDQRALLRPNACEPDR